MEFLTFLIIGALMAVSWIVIGKLFPYVITIRWDELHGWSCDVVDRHR